MIDSSVKPISAHGAPKSTFGIVWTKGVSYLRGRNKDSGLVRATVSLALCYLEYRADLTQKTTGGEFGVCVIMLMHS